MPATPPPTTTALRVMDPLKLEFSHSSVIFLSMSWTCTGKATAPARAVQISPVFSGVGAEGVELPRAVCWLKVLIMYKSVTCVDHPTARR